MVELALTLTQPSWFLSLQTSRDPKLGGVEAECINSQLTLPWLDSGLGFFIKTTRTQHGGESTQDGLS